MAEREWLLPEVNDSRSHNDRRVLKNHYNNVSTSAMIASHAQRLRQLLPRSLLQLSLAQLGSQSFLLVRLRASGPGTCERCCTSFLGPAYRFEICWNSVNASLPIQAMPGALGFHASSLFHELRS
ncbi:hypothetical protein K474DRAFT_1655245 [Panus rudis PR-1116 ss-1]|nr:hypothetical protein K474DRAFT_1655245 [Panus rudis PR-1116 ss-1]